MTRFLALALGALVAIAGPAAAEVKLSPAERKRVMDTCGADFRKLCPAAFADGRPSRSRLAPCVRSHFDDLSGGCKVLLVEIRLTGE